MNSFLCVASGIYHHTIEAAKHSGYKKPINDCYYVMAPMPCNYSLNVPRSNIIRYTGLRIFDQKEKVVEL